MDIETRRRLRERGIVLATSGLLMALAVSVPLILTEVIHVSIARWAACALLTISLQTVMWLLPRRRWDAHLGWDPRFIVVPTLSFTLLLHVYAYFIPEARQFVLMMWFVALVFMAGLADMAHVVALSGTMAVGHVAAVYLSPWRTPDIRLADTAALASVFWIINGYAGLIFDRLRQDRREMQSLRRRLAELALTDQLTGLPNRRRYEEALTAERARAVRYGGHFCAAIIDVDHFKNYNDRHGHLAGDGVLRGVAEILRAALRDGDLVARYGGEEFAVLMVNTVRAEALPVVERLRGAVELHPFEGEAVQPLGRLTVSAGVAEWTFDGTDETMLMAAADAALYRAKAAGRNRVLMAIASAAT